MTYYVVTSFAVIACAVITCALVIYTVSRNLSTPKPRKRDLDSVHTVLIRLGFLFFPLCPTLHELSRANRRASHNKLNSILST